MRRFLTFYKTPLLLSLTLFVVFTSVRVETNIFAIVLLALGTFLGTFLLDAEYFIFSYILEPSHLFSQSFTAFIKDKDFSNALMYAHHNQESIKDKTLNSVLFQLALGGLSFFVVSTSATLLVKALLLSGFANSIYKLIEKYYAHNTDDWFWAIKNKPTPRQTVFYITFLLVLFAYCVSLL